MLPLLPAAVAAMRKDLDLHTCTRVVRVRICEAAVVPADEKELITRIILQQAGGNHTLGTPHQRSCSGTSHSGQTPRTGEPRG